MALLRRFMLALCVWREARNQSQLGKNLVAAVIKNRVQDPRWPDTYVGVVTQRRQFSSFNAGDPNATLFPLETDGSWKGCVVAADVVLSSREPLTSANHYHTVDVHPVWADASKVVAREGAHIFYCL